MNAYTTKVSLDNLEDTLNKLQKFGLIEDFNSIRKNSGCKDVFLIYEDRELDWSLYYNDDLEIVDNEKFVKLITLDYCFNLLKEIL